MLATIHTIPITAIVLGDNQMLKALIAKSFI